MGMLAVNLEGQCSRVKQGVSPFPSASSVNGEGQDKVTSGGNAWNMRQDVVF